MALHSTVRLTLRGSQRMSSQDAPDVTELITQASCRLKDGVHYLFYEEAQEDGGTLRCRLRFDGTQLHVRKEGPGGYELDLKSGESRPFTLPTPMGLLGLDLTGVQIDLVQGPDALRLLARYELWYGDALLSINETEILAENLAIDA